MYVFALYFYAASFTNLSFTGTVYKYMSTSPNPNGAAPIPPDKSTVILLLNTIGDTTWRMFVPSIGFTIIGVITDRQLGTKPWLTVVGIVVGSVVAGLLVRRQIKRVQQK